jgi:uncharacterized protein YdhG (YjbR/CyaY superfamily)
MADHFTSIDDYISTFPEPVRTVLEEVRRTIRRVLPDAVETIRYDMPTFAVDGKSLVHFAGWKKHIGIYPMPQADAETEQEFGPYTTEKGTGQFSLKEPVPYDVIEHAVAKLLEQRRASAEATQQSTGS